MNVRFASESRHRLSALGRPLCATTGREEAQLTSSARARRSGEISMFRAFVVFRLGTNVNLSACSSGRFAGLSPPNSIVAG